MDKTIASDVPPSGPPPSGAVSQTTQYPKSANTTQQDNPEATPQPSTMAFLHLPEEQSFDKTAANLLKVVKKLIGDSFDLIANEFDRKMKDEMTSFQRKVDEKVVEMNQTCASTQKRIEPVLPLLNIAEPGRSLIDSISNYVTETSVVPQINQVKNYILPQYVEKAELKQEMQKEEKDRTQAIGHLRQHINMEVENLRKKCLFSDTFDRFRNETTIMLDDLKRKEQNMASQIMQLQDQSKHLAEQVAKKADSDRVWELQAKLDDYATRDQFIQLEYSVTQCTTKEETEEVKKDLRGKFAYLKSIVDTHATKEEASKQVEKLREQVAQDIKVFHKTQDFLAFRQSNELAIKDLHALFPPIEEKFHQNTKELTVIREVLATKASDSDLKLVATDLTKFAFRSDLADLAKKLLPELDAFRVEMYSFKKEREQHTEILLRYDEVILEKASKFQLAQLREDIYRGFAKLMHLNELEERFNEHALKSKEHHEHTLQKFEEINKALSTEIYSAVKKAIKKMSKMLERTKEEQENKSKGMGKDLLSLISSKAAAADLEELAHQKANKVDTEQLLDSLLIVHRQLKQALVLVMDSLRSALENPTETQQKKEHKQRFILTQLGFLARWVLTYDPLHLNHTNQGEGADFLQQPDGKALQDYTDMLMREAAHMSHQNLGSLPVNLRVGVVKSRGSQRKQNHSMTQSPYNLPDLSNNPSMAIMKSALESMKAAGQYPQQQQHHHSPVPPHNLSQLSFISHQDHGKNPLEGEYKQPQSFMTIDKTSLQVTLKHAPHHHRAAPKLDTAPTSPLALRDKGSGIGFGKPRVIRGSPKVIDGTPMKPNPTDQDLMKLSEYSGMGGTQRLHQGNANSQRVILVNKPTLDLPPLV